MKIRSVLPIAFVGAGVLGFVYACSAPDPGAIVYVPRTTQTQTGGDDSGVQTGGGTDGGTEEGGTTSTNPNGNAFFGEGPYEAGVAAENAKGTQHNGLKNSQNQAIPTDGGVGDPSGMNCLDSSCHGPGGGGPGWTFAGTVYTAASTQGGAGIEVRVIDGTNGKVLDTVFTDPQGNFFSQTQNAVPTNMLAGARNATTSMSMGTSAMVGCNASGCHAAGNQPMLP